MAVASEVGTVLINIAFLRENLGSSKHRCSMFDVTKIELVINWLCALGNIPLFACKCGIWNIGIWPKYYPPACNMKLRTTARRLMVTSVPRQCLTRIARITFEGKIHLFQASCSHGFISSIPAIRTRVLISRSSTCTWNDDDSSAGRKKIHVPDTADCIKKARVASVTNSD